MNNTIVNMLVTFEYTEEYELFSFIVYLPIGKYVL